MAADRKRSQTALQGSQRLNQAVLGSLGANIAVLDRAGNIIAVNEAWKRFAYENNGAALAEAVGMNYLGACLRSLEHGDEDARKALNGIQEVLNNTRQDFQIEYACHSPSQKRWFLMSVTPLVGERGGAVVTHTEISGRKQVEEALQEGEARLKLAMEAGEIGMFDWNIQTNEVIWSEESKATFGLPHSESVGGYDDWAQRVHPEDLPTCESSIKAALQNKQTHWHGEYRMTNTGEAHQRWVNSTGRILYDDRGEPIRMIGTNMDVTERKRAEEALRQSEARLRHVAEVELRARRQAEEANRMKDEFLALVSHELRSPLNAMVGYARLLRHRPLDPQKIDKAVEVIERGGRAQTQLIEDLLDSARIIS